jgi:hypothetical protein
MININTNTNTATFQNKEFEIVSKKINDFESVNIELKDRGILYFLNSDIIIDGKPYYPEYFEALKLPPNWIMLEQNLRYSNLFTKAFSDASEKGLSLFMITLVNGKSGDSSENSLSFAFSLLGVNWSDSEKLELNNILENNNFTIRI